MCSSQKRRSPTRSAGGRDEAPDGDAGGGGRTAGQGRPAGAHPPLEPLLRARDRGGGTRDLHRDRRATRLRRRRGAIRGAGDAAPGQGRGDSPSRARGRIIGAAMTEMVRVAVAGDVAEAEEIQEILRAAGIDTELHDGEDDSVTVSVPEDSVEQAQDAIETMTEPDDLVGEP